MTGRTARVRPRLLAALTGVLLAGAAAPSSASDAPPAGGVRVLSGSLVGEQTQLVVAAPPPPGAVEPVPGFTLEQAGVASSLTVQPLPVGELAVVIVLASSDETSASAFTQGQVAALEVLAGLPAGARSALLSTSRSAPLAGLSADRAGASEALRDARAGSGDLADGALQRAAALLPRGGHVVLLSDGDAGRGAALPQGALAQRDDGLVVHRISYRPDGTTPVGAAVTPSTAAPVLRQVDDVLAVLAHQYRLQAVLDPFAAATLSVRRAGALTQALVPPTRSLAQELGGVYAEPAGRSTTLVAGGALAGLLGLVGLLVLLRRPRRDVAGDRPDDELLPDAPAEVHVDRQVPVGARGGR